MEYVHDENLFRYSRKLTDTGSLNAIGMTGGNEQHVTKATRGLMEDMHEFLFCFVIPPSIPNT